MLRCFLIILLIPAVAYCQQWQGFDMPLSYNNAYTSFCDTLNQKLYVVGDYRPSNIINQNHVCFYDGVKWDTLSGEFDNVTRAVAVFNNELYIGGYFTMVNGNYSTGIVKWNGNNFEYFENRLNDLVTMLKVVDNKLLVGGVFSLADSLPASGLAWFDGVNFTPLPINTFSLFQPFDAVKYDSMLIVTGNIDDTLNYNIVCLKDGVWIDFPAGGILGSDAAIADAEVFDNMLYVGGYFYKNWGNSGNFIQYYDGTAWKEAGGGTSYFPNSSENAQVHCLKTHNGKLYAGGLFNFAGDIPANKLAVWDGIKWCGFGTAFNEIGRVFSIEFYKDSMFVFGNFTEVNGIQALSVAKWLGGDYIDTCSQNSDVQEVISETRTKVFPNPIQNNITIDINEQEFLTAEKNKIEYKVIDLFGREIKTGEIEESPFTLSFDNFPKGVYLIVLRRDLFVRQYTVVKE